MLYIDVYSITVDWSNSLIYKEELAFRFTFRLRGIAHPRNMCEKSKISWPLLLGFYESTKYSIHLV